MGHSEQGDAQVMTASVDGILHIRRHCGSTLIQDGELGTMVEQTGHLRGKIDNKSIDKIDN